MADKQKERLLKQCSGLIKKCKELDRAMNLDKKKAKYLTSAESKELRKLRNKILRWCIK